MTAKNIALEVIKNQPEDSTIGELVEELVMVDSINRGIEDSINGRVISTEELEKEIDSWE